MGLWTFARDETVDVNRLFCSFLGMLNDHHNVRPKLKNSPSPCPHLLELPELRWISANTTKPVGLRKRITLSHLYRNISFESSRWIGWLAARVRAHRGYSLVSL